MRAVASKLPQRWTLHPPAAKPMAAWFKVVSSAAFTKFADVRRTFNSADRVGEFVVFDVGANERHPLAGLLDVLGDLVTAYEAREVPLPGAEPRDVLRLLMETNGLTQTELGIELGGQSVVSAILNGRRVINARQARALAQRFGVSPVAFIP